MFWKKQQNCVTLRYVFVILRKMRVKLITWALVISFLFQGFRAGRRTYFPQFPVFSNAKRHFLLKDIFEKVKTHKTKSLLLREKWGHLNGNVVFLQNFSRILSIVYRFRKHAQNIK